MAMSTVAQMIKAAVRALGVLDSYNDLTANEYANGLETLNSMLALWAIEGITILQDVTQNFPTVAGTSLYTIGSGGTVAVARPMRITGAYLRYSGVDYPVGIITQDQYESIPLKTVQTLPDRLFYNPVYPLGEINLYPVPDKVYTLYFDSQNPIGNFAGTDAALNLPPEVEAAIKWNLAVDSSPDYSVMPSDVVLQRARNSKDAISRFEVAPATFEGGCLGGARGGGRFNFNTGDFR